MQTDSPFGGQTLDGVTVWAGQPDCGAGHVAILRWLRDLGANFLTEPVVVDNRLKGNLGESIAFYIGYFNEYEGESYRCFPVNALSPFSGMSKPDIDVVWLHFGQQPGEDFAVIQEVKTTGEKSLQLADRLVDDFDKLFGSDIRFTIHTRIQAINNELEYRHRRKDLAERAASLAGNAPATSSAIRLLPTLVYDRELADPLPKLTVVRSVLLARGWTPASVKVWAIGMSELDSRLGRIAVGNP